MYSCCTYGIFNVASLKINCLLNMTCSTQIKGSGLFLMTSVFPDLLFHLLPVLPPLPSENSVHLLAHLMTTAICTCKWRFQYCVHWSASVLGLEWKNKLNCQENCRHSAWLLGASWPSWLNVGIHYQRRLLTCYRNESWRKICSLRFQSVPF